MGIYFFDLCWWFKFKKRTHVQYHYHTFWRFAYWKLTNSLSFVEWLIRLINQMAGPSSWAQKRTRRISQLSCFYYNIVREVKHALNIQIDAPSMMDQLQWRFQTTLCHLFSGPWIVQNVGWWVLMMIHEKTINKLGMISRVRIPRGVEKETRIETPRLLVSRTHTWHEIWGL